MTALAVEVIDVPAGAWMRERWLPVTFQRAKPRTEPEWRGAWHQATGDREWEPQWHDRHGPNVVARCGRKVEASVQRRGIGGAAYADVVVAERAPQVDVCRRCARYAGVELPERGRDDWRSRAAARIVQDEALSDEECRRRLRMLFGTLVTA